MDDEGLAEIIMTEDGWQRFTVKNGKTNQDPSRCSEVTRQFDEYFQGKRRKFDVKLSIKGPEFSRNVWRALLEIPYGETRTYAEIAQAIGKPKSYRAVGQANRGNPIPIVIPCHRVIGKDGSMTGYIGKGYIPLKEYLLEMERKFR